jgi:hypothetical protein
MSELSKIQMDFGPDTDREIELKHQLAELQERYRQEAQPLLDELIKIRAIKIPRISITAAQIAELFRSDEP